MGVEGRRGEHSVRCNLTSMNELLRNSIAGDQSGIQLLPGVGVASPESVVIAGRCLVVIGGTVQIQNYGKTVS